MACSNHGCLVERKEDIGRGGMRTNGPCQCTDKRNLEKMGALVEVRRCLQERRNLLSDMSARAGPVVHRCGEGYGILGLTREQLL